MSVNTLSRTYSNLSDITKEDANQALEIAGSATSIASMAFTAAAVIGAAGAVPTIGASMIPALVIGGVAGAIEAVKFANNQRSSPRTEVSEPAATEVMTRNHDL